MRPPAASRCTPQLLMGLAVLVTGVVVLLHNLGIADLRQYLGYWPWLLMLLTVVQVFEARLRHPEFRRHDGRSHRPRRNQSTERSAGSDDRDRPLGGARNDDRHAGQGRASP
jgi:hypothetical protein